MRLQLASLSPLVSFVVVIHITKKQAGFRFMKDQPDVFINIDRVEPLVPGLIEFMEFQSGRDAFSWRSKAVTFTAFCSSLVSLARLVEKVSARRKFMFEQRS